MFLRRVSSDDIVEVMDIEQTGHDFYFQRAIARYWIDPHYKERKI